MEISYNRKQQLHREIFYLKSTTNKSDAKRISIFSGRKQIRKSDEEACMKRFGGHSNERHIWTALESFSYSGK